MLASLIGGAILSWITALYYFKKGQSKKLLCYSIVSYSFLGRNRREFEGLTVSYKDNKIQDPVKYTIFVWNCGNVTIDGKEISRSDPVGFEYNNAEILEIAPARPTRSSISPKISLEARKSCFFLDFDFLDPDDGIAIELIVNRNSANSAPPKIRGTVKGLNRAPVNVAARFNRNSWIGSYLSVASAAFFGFSTALMGYDSWQSGFGFEGIVKGFSCFMFLILSITSIAAFFSSLPPIQDPTIPPLLRRQGEREDDIWDAKRELDRTRESLQIARQYLDE
ncbi:hypothetical protein [Rhodoplanes elegans]|nr:hypothetical protein [Rhodoplanes elegans]